MLRRLYDWVMSLAASRHASLSLFAISFSESSFFPVPPDIMLAPMVLAKPEKAWRYAALCTVASVLGGMLGYGIGFFFHDGAQRLLALLGKPHALADAECWFRHYGSWVIIAKGFTPIPFKLVTITSGLLKFSFPIFVGAATLTRAARFFLVAGVVKKFGPAMLPVIEKRLALFAGIVIALLVIGLAASHFLGGSSRGACVG
jgi:membrane protein YqaA with SNARE-associated domain